MGYISITNPQISGGSEVDLGATSVKLGFKTFTPVPAVPGKDSTATWDTRLDEIDNLGFDNPIYNITGVFDATQSTNNDGSVLISPRMLGSFATIGSPSWFKDDYFILNPVGSAFVVIDGFNMDRNIQSKFGSTEGHIVRYSAVLKESKVF